MRWNPAYPVLATLLLTLACASCRQEPLPASGELIRFSVSPAVSSAPTKVDLPDVAAPGDLLDQNGNTVRVWGTYQVGTDPQTYNVFGNNAYLTLSCTGAGSAASWSYTEGRYYWNRNADYKFRSVFTDGHVGDIQSGSNVNAVTVAFSGGYDLMVSGITVPKGEVQSANLRFLHACAAVRFYCVDPYGGNAASTGYTISSFAVNQVAKSGTLAYAGYSSAIDATVTGWTPGSLDDISVTVSSWPVPGISVQDIETAGLSPWFYFVPQTLDDDAAIQFTVNSGTQTSVIERKLKAGGLPTQWEAGRMYTYFILIQPNVGLDFTITPWNENVVNGKYRVH